MVGPQLVLYDFASPVFRSRHLFVKVSGGGGGGGSVISSSILALTQSLDPRSSRRLSLIRSRHWVLARSIGVH